MYTNRGVLRPPTAGTLTLTFSNAHSRFRKKTVHLRLRGGMGDHETSLREKTPFSSAPPLEVSEEELASTITGEEGGERTADGEAGK